MIVETSVSMQLRALIAIIALICILGAIFPDSDLIPFRNNVESSRTVQAATQATRWLFLSGGSALVFAFAAWHWILKQVAAGVGSISRWSNKTFWSVVCVLGLGLRLPVLLFVPPSALTSDGAWYHNAAIAIAAGQGLQLHGLATAYRPPGYSTLLALTYRLFGPYPEWAWFWGIASVGIILLTTYRLADQFYGKTIAKIATLIISLYPALILYTGHPMSDLVFTAGLMLVCYVVALRPPYRWLETISIGVALGLLTLTRSISIGLLVVIPALWFIKEANFRKLILNSILLTCVFAACLAPWVLRNYAVFGTPTIATNMGLVLYMGNHADASGGVSLTVIPPLVTNNDLQLNEAQIDRIFLREAIQFVIEHPIDALAVVPKKLISLFLLEVTSAQLSFQDKPFLLKYTSYGITQLFYLPIIVFFLIRMLNLLDPAARPRGIQWMGFVIIGYFTLMAMFLFGIDRYRLPFMPFMIIESSVVATWLGPTPKKNPLRA